MRFLPPILFLLVACSSERGSDVTVDASPNGTIDAAVEADASVFAGGLECTTISLCTTYEADPSRVPFPETSGGTLQDGLYRAVQGSSLPYGLAIHEGNYSLIFENLTVAHGDIDVQNDIMTMTQHTNCAPGIVNDDPAFEMTFESFFKAEGNELITYSGCDSLDPDNCNSPTRLLRVTSLCDELDQLSCENGDCNCATFTDGTIPDRPTGGNCEF